MNKVKFLSSEHRYNLEREINEFIGNKNVISISYTTNSVGYSVHHYCCVLYVE